MADRFIPDDVSPDVLGGINGWATAVERPPAADKGPAADGQEASEEEEGAPPCQVKPAADPAKSQKERVDTADLATTREDVLNQFPFAGTVFRRESGDWAYLDRIPSSDPTNLQAFKLRSDVTPGEYRLITTNGRREIRFSLAGAGLSQEREEPSPATGQDEKSQEMQLLKLRREIERERETHTERRERRLRGEIDDLSRKLLRTQQELATHQAKADRERREAVEALRREHRTEMRRLKEKLEREKEKVHELEMKKLRLEIERDAGGGTSLWQSLHRLIENNGEELLKIIPQVLASQNGQANPQQIKQLMQKAQQAQHAQQQQMQRRTNPAGDGQATGDVPGVEVSQQQDSAGPEKASSQSENADSQSGSDMVLTPVARQIIEEARGVIGQELTEPLLQQFVIQVGTLLESNPEQQSATTFTAVAKHVAELALEKGAPAERIARLLEPFLPLLDKQYLTAMQIMQPKQIVELLCTTFDVELSTVHKDYMVGVMKEMKRAT